MHAQVTNFFFLNPAKNASTGVSCTQGIRIGPAMMDAASRRCDVAIEDRDANMGRGDETIQPPRAMIPLSLYFQPANKREVVMP